MTTVTTTPDSTTLVSPLAAPSMTLEVVVLPVADVDRAIAFYAALGWQLDIDRQVSSQFRVVEFTPPGSATSIIFGTGVSCAAPGSVQGLHLVVSDIEACRTALLQRRVQVGEIFHDAGGVFHHAGTTDRVAGPATEHRSYGSFMALSDPDGNGWIVQEVTQRIPGRITQASYGNEAELAAALRRAAAAHGAHEEHLGHQDRDWPGWYAAFLLREQLGLPLPA